MATDYPGDIDSFAVKTDNVTDVMAADVNDLQDAVEAIETELGSDPAGTAADVKTRLAQSLDGLGNLDFKAIGALTISGGSVTPTQNWHVIDTEGGGAADDLDTIAVTNVTDGFILFLRQANDSRDVTIKHDTGNIKCPGGVDIALADTTQAVMLIYDGTLTKWLASICPANVALTNKANTWAAEQILTKSERHAYTSISTNTTLDATQNVVDVDATSASVAITLPTAVGINGREYVIRKLDSSANAVTITPNGSETVNGSSDIVLDEQYESTIIYSDGANWIQLATGGGGGASSDLIEHAHTGSTDGGLLRIDTIAAPTDTTANDVSLSAHGLFPKLPGTSDTYWNGVGEWATITGGSASSDLIEHGHTGAADGGALKLDDLQPPDDTTSLDASTNMHGLLPKLSGLTNVYLRGDGAFSGIIVATPTQVGGGFSTVTSNFIAGTTDYESYYRFVSQDNFNSLMNSATTDFDASTDTHGFLPKLSGTSDNFLNGKGEYVAPHQVMIIKLIDDAMDLPVGNSAFVFPIPPELNGANLIDAQAAVSTAPTSDTPSSDTVTYQIRNVTDTVDMLSTPITIDTTEYTSYTAAAARVIDTAHDDVATADLIAIDKDVAGVGEMGDTIILTFEIP